MATATGAALSIKVSQTGTRRSLDFFPRDERKAPIEIPLNAQYLNQARGNLLEQLERFKESIGEELTVTARAEAAAALQRLYLRGVDLIQRLFGKDSLSEVQQLLRAACPQWHDAETLINVEQQPPLIEIDAQLDDLLPFELLPLFDWRGEFTRLGDLRGAALSDARTLKLAACAFPAFVARIKRNILPAQQSATSQEAVRRIQRLAQNTRLVNEPQLPVRLFRHAGLANAEAEHAFFRGHAGIRLTGPWPTDACADRDDFIRELAKHLWNCHCDFKEAALLPPDQIIHFACHCETTNLQKDPALVLNRDAYTASPLLVLAHDANSDVQVDLWALSGHFTRFESSENLLPLIFFNACGSAVINPTSLSSFPGVFLDNGFRGFIGTEAHIPDKFAAEFSKQFYTYLLEGKSLGLALQMAKWRLLRLHNNPLGLLYTAYANPDIHVSTPKLPAPLPVQ